MLFFKRDKNAFDMGYWDGRNDNTFRLNHKVNKRSYLAGYRAGQRVIARRGLFNDSQLSSQHAKIA